MLHSLKQTSLKQRPAALELDQRNADQALSLGSQQLTATSQTAKIPTMAAGILYALPPYINQSQQPAAKAILRWQTIGSVSAHKDNKGYSLHITAALTSLRLAIRRPQADLAIDTFNMMPAPQRFASNGRRVPDGYIYTVSKTAQQNHWHKIGLVFDHADGQGYSLHLDDADLASIAADPSLCIRRK